MRYSAISRQARVAALGFHPGPIDGIIGKRTRDAEQEAMSARGVHTVEELFHPSGLHRIHMHWTAGAEGVIELEKKHYHFIIDADANVVNGHRTPDDNGEPINGAYAAHTLNANSGAIGVSIDAMAGANERPLRWGSEPMTEAQVDAMCCLVAELCERYDIPVSKYSTLTHAEVQPTLGITQKWKWDITVLPGMSAVGDAVEIGDVIRQRIRAFASEKKEKGADTASPVSELRQLTDGEKIRQYDKLTEVFLKGYI